MYHTAELDTDSGIVVGLAQPEFIVNVEVLRQELITEIRKKKAEAGVDGIDEDKE